MVDEFAFDANAEAGFGVFFDGEPRGGGAEGENAGRCGLGQAGGGGCCGGAVEGEGDLIGGRPPRLEDIGQSANSDDADAQSDAPLYNFSGAGAGWSTWTPRRHIVGAVTRFLLTCWGLQGTEPFRLSLRLWCRTLPVRWGLASFRQTGSCGSSVTIVV